MQHQNIRHIDGIWDPRRFTATKTVTPPPAPPLPTKKTRRLSRVLIGAASTLSLVIALAFLLAPYSPFVSNIFQNIAQILPSEASTAEAADTTQADTLTLGSLEIPSIHLNAPIVATMRGAKGEAMWPEAAGNLFGSSPHNTVLAAHRFTYTYGKGAFYSLPDIAVGDTIIAHTKGTEARYRVTQTKVVDPTSVEILKDTPTEQLTLFTCADLLSTARRFVVIALPEE